MAVRQFDVCNGDADGLCATVQWRWHRPAAAQLITGLKREIALLAQLEPLGVKAGDQVQVFDLSMQRNQPALMRLLAVGVQVLYVDHHAPGAVPVHPLLQAHVETAGDVCTSLIVDRLLAGASRHWALVGAYGDNLTQVADALAVASGLGAAERSELRRLGEAINYNAYGDTAADVCIHPLALYGILAAYRDPLALTGREPIIDQIEAQRQQDLAQAMALLHVLPGARSGVLTLPDAPWSRRVQGCVANELANAQPGRAHAVLKARPDGSSLVSVRAPILAPRGADVLCARFGGSGRARAAGIDALSAAQVPAFLDAFAAAWADLS
jgi:hypothetical protein